MKNKRTISVKNRVYGIRKGSRSQKLHDLGYKTYPQYLLGVEWRNTRVKFLNSSYVTRIDGILVCSECKTPETNLSRPLNIHHKTYKNVGKEELTDLLLVCEGCHGKIHSKRAKRKTTRTKT